MKTYGATFEYRGEMKTIKSGRKVPKNYFWWETVISHFIDRSDIFRIECWFDDYEGLTSAARYGARNSEAGFKIISQMEIWEGFIDEYFKYELIKTPFDKEKKIKWYSIFFKKNGKTLFCSEKYGTSLSVYGVNERDLAFLSKQIQDESFSFYVWEEAKSGQEVGFESVLMGDDDISSLIEALQPKKGSPYKKSTPNEQDDFGGTNN